MPTIPVKLQSVNQAKSFSGIRNKGLSLRCNIMKATAAPAMRSATRFGLDIDRKMIFPKIGQVPKRI